MKDSLHDQQFTGPETLTTKRQPFVSATGSASALRFPPDMAEANEAAGAACGQFAFAASLLRNVEDVLQYFPGLREGKSWCSVKTIEQALTMTGTKWQAVGAGWPGWGLAIVQGLGPWMKPGVPFGARLSRTHWVATCVSYGERMIADANAPTWLTLAEWERGPLARILVRWKAEGWEVKRGYEVTLND